ncbi:CBS domain-containing membrane protein [Noviherbaspirillum humi]|uniref:CBS domain-containing membrane protein n=1 Tax=Noviherbaspirillum humi TaxID=1688639 RepID=A0A239DMV7_9BURK|nr:HPP family protein [Noviherbaspirillum humi]SNS33826.1 CBS domain-containing membrane protein [Noviherbaspirillum humi]
MLARLLSHLQRYLPTAPRIDSREKARSILGAALGIFVTGLLSRTIVGADSDLPWLLAPMGASAVLLFAVPASPLAQPWSVMGGNLLSAAVGLSCARFVGAPLAAASLALASALLIMMALRCMHPPGGAVALGSALGGPALAQHGFLFTLGPLALNSLLLVLAAVAYNNLCGRRYPHRTVDHANQHQTRDKLPTDRLGVTAADLDMVLRQYNQVLDVSHDDLEEILLRAERQAHQRRFGLITCADLMSRDVVKVEFGTDLEEAWRLLRVHGLEVLPVVNRFQRVIGIISERDFFRHAGGSQPAELAGRLRRLIARTPGTNSDKPEVVGQIMSTTRTAFEHEAVTSLVPLFSDGGVHTLPIIDANERLVGMLAQSDVVAALYHAGLGREGEANGKAALRRIA